MDEQEGMRLAGLALSSDERITLDLTIRDLWLIVSALQLVVAQEAIHEPLKEISEQIGRGLQMLIVARLPEVEALMEMGWQREYDYVVYDDDEYYDYDYDDPAPDDDDDDDPEDDTLTDRNFGHYGFP
jgi:hypothetical protein